MADLLSANQETVKRYVKRGQGQVRSDWCGQLLAAIAEQYGIENDRTVIGVVVRMQNILKL